MIRTIATTHCANVPRGLPTSSQILTTASISHSTNSDIMLESDKLAMDRSHIVSIGQAQGTPGTDRLDRGLPCTSAASPLEPESL